MSALITIVHIIVCFVLIIAVLLQSGKAADLAGAFGGGGSQTVFGPRGAATILTKVTTICAILFMVTSFGLRVLSSRGESSVVRGAAAQTTETRKAAAEETAEEKKQPAEKKAPEKKSRTADNLKDHPVPKWWNLVDTHG